MTDQPRYVLVYGADHSPWVQAVLLGLHEAGIAHRLTPLPPWDTFRTKGITMPAASLDGAPWQLESTDILESLGYDAVTPEDLARINSAWRGVLHRADSAAHFWGGFGLAGPRDGSLPGRLIRNFFRSFVTLYFFLVIRTVNLMMRPKDPENFGDQFVPFDERLRTSGQPFLSSDTPNTLDFLLFGIIQCHSSIWVPPVSALQSDPRLGQIRAWIGRMQERFAGYGHLYSGLYFPPHSPPPAWASGIERLAFWFGTLFMLAAFPVTVPLVAFLAIRNRQG
jgi:glutathione S-transferase